MKIAFVVFAFIVTSVGCLALGLMVGYALENQGIYGEICGYDYVGDIHDKVERDAICNHLSGR